MSEETIRSVMASLVASITCDRAGEHRFGSKALQQAVAGGRAMERASRVVLINGLVRLLGEMVDHVGSATLAVLQIHAVARTLLSEGIDRAAEFALDPRAAALLGMGFDDGRLLKAREPAPPGSFSWLGLRCSAGK